MNDNEVADVVVRVVKNPGSSWTMLVFNFPPIEGQVASTSASEFGRN